MPEFELHPEISDQTALWKKIQRVKTFDPLFIRSRDEAVDFNVYSVEIPAPVSEFLNKFVQLQNLMLSQGLRIDNINKESFAGQITLIDSQYLNIRQQIWDLVANYLHIGLPFSEENLNFILMYELPKNLAQFGIFSNGAMIRLNNSSNPNISMGYVVQVFHLVKSKEVKKVLNWTGQTETVPQLFLSDLAGLNQPNEAQLSFLQKGSFSSYCNIVRLGKDREFTEQEKKKARAVMDANMAINEKQYLQVINSSNTPMQVAGSLAIAQILKRKGINFMFSEDYASKVENHETGHVIFTRQFAKALELKPASNINEFNKDSADISYSVHHEIEATLLELRRHIDKDRDILNLLGFLQQGIQQDFQHDEAVNWVFERMVNLIKRDPGKYGIVIDFESSVSHDHQIIMQLAKVSANPKWVEELVDEIHEIHIKNLGQTFLAKFYRSQNLSVPAGVVDKPIAETLYEVKKPFPAVEVGVGALGAVGLVVGGVALNRLRQRKELVRMKERLPKLLKQLRIPDKRKKDLVKKLQFDVDKSKVYVQLRENALQELEKAGLDEKVVRFLKKSFEIK